MGKQFERPEGHEDCCFSKGICDSVTFGTGELDSNGYWENPCDVCARAWEKQFPESGETWPAAPSSTKIKLLKNNFPRDPGTYFYGPQFGKIQKIEIDEMILSWNEWVQDSYWSDKIIFELEE